MPQLPKKPAFLAIAQDKKKQASGDQDHSKVGQNEGGFPLTMLFRRYFLFFGCDATQR
jgi:hypothetical protein